MCLVDVGWEVGMMTSFSWLSVLFCFFPCDFGGVAAQTCWSVDLTLTLTLELFYIDCQTKAQKADF